MGLLDPHGRHGARDGGADLNARALFPTLLYEAALGDPGLLAELTEAALGLAAEDRAGRAWCKAHRYPGYTSYASLNDLPTRATAFGALKRKLDRQAAAFADKLGFDLGVRGRLKLDSLWVNLIRSRGGGGSAAHSGHIHPLSVLSGTLYLAAPEGAGAIRFEDPRLALMMAAPPLRASASEASSRFVTVQPRPGLLLLWESWLRHEVLAGTSNEPRISVSFNYAWR